MIVNSIGVAEITVGVLLVIGFVICCLEIKKTLKHIDRKNKVFVESPVHWDD